MTRLLVHLHLYYTDQCDYFIEKLQNICACSWDLYVTVVKQEPSVCEKIKRSFPDAKIILVENKGYDIWPFLQIIHSVDLDKYDYILKLHTKGYYNQPTRVNKFWYEGYEWRNIMVDSLLKSREHFQELLDIFEKSPMTGMMCSSLFYMKLSNFLPEDCSLHKAEMKRIGIPLKGNRFMAGSMFMARVSPYKLLQQAQISAENFTECMVSHSFGDIAHVYERILTLVVKASGLKVRTISYNRIKEAYLHIFKENIQPVVEYCFSLRREGEDKIKTLRLFSIPIRFRKKTNNKAAHNKILIHLHLFYFDQTDYFIEKLGRISSCNTGLFVTIVRHDETSEKKLTAAFPNVKIMLVENRGGDVWPFIQVIQSVDLRNYDYVLKLHTKSANVSGLVNNGVMYKNYQWRDALVDAVLKDNETFTAALSKLQASEKNGIAYNVLFRKKVSKDMLEYAPLITELERLGITVSDLHYVAGTMFLAKAWPYRVLQTSKITADTFPDEFKTHSYGSTSHIYEFICSLVVNAAGMTTKTLSKNIWQTLYIKVYIDIVQVLLQEIFSIRNILGNKVITVFGIRIPLKKNQA